MSADTLELVTYLAQALVDSSDEVRVDVRTEEGRVLYEVTVAADDIGKVIGRQGRIIKAIRTLARAAGASDDTQVDVDILG